MSHYLPYLEFFHPFYEGSNVATLSRDELKEALHRYCAERGLAHGIEVEPSDRPFNDIIPDVDRIIDEWGYETIGWAAYYSRDPENQEPAIYRLMFDNSDLAMLVRLALNA